MQAARGFLRASPLYSAASQHSIQKPTTRAQLIGSIVLSLVLIGLFVAVFWSWRDTGTEEEIVAAERRSSLIDIIILVLLLGSLLIPLLIRIYKYFKQSKTKPTTKAAEPATTQQLLCTCEPVVTEDKQS